jgi:hypothetical protein
LPQATHRFWLQVTLPAVHSLVVQQGWARPPQVPQLPAVQVAPLAQAVPCPRQVFLLQHPPAPQVPPAQQAEPGVPHATQMPLAEGELHTLAGLAHVPPVQHGSPGPPQVAQTPPWQDAPASLQGGELPQQGSPSLPQATQVLAAPQTTSGPMHFGSVAQQGSFRWPQTPESPITGNSSRASLGGGASRRASDGGRSAPASVRPGPSLGEGVESEQASGSIAAQRQQPRNSARLLKTASLNGMDPLNRKTPTSVNPSKVRRCDGAHSGRTWRSAVRQHLRQEREPRGQLRAVPLVLLRPDR